MIIALDAGHGVNTAGKRIPIELDPNETREWTLNNRVCGKIQNILREYEGIEVIRLDDESGGEENVPLETRVQTANKAGAELVVSIHHNAGILGGTGGGIVAYSYPGSMAGKTWRDAFYDRLIERTGLSGNRANPKAEASFYILRYTAAPTVLLELGFMDSRTDVPIILTEAYANACAEAIASVIAEGFLLEKRGEKRYNRVSEMPEWARETVEKLLRKGYLKGYDDTGESLDLSEDMLRVLVINDRAGVFGE